MWVGVRRTALDGSAQETGTTQIQEHKTMKTPSNLKAMLSLLVLTSAASAQFTSYDGAMEEAMRQFNQLNQRIQQSETHLVQQNMQNPEVQRRYREFLAAGGNATPEQYAYYYAATAGGTAEGIANYNRTTNTINANDRRAISDYHNHVSNLWQETHNYRNEVNERINRGRGENLTGNGTYVNPWTNTTYQLPYTVPANTYHYDSSTGNGYTVDGQGSYWMNSGNGWWSQLRRQ